MSAHASPARRARPGAGPAALLNVRDVSVIYSTAGRKLVALRNVTLDLKPGELVALLGPNGCGKTTLIRAVMGAVRPLAGQLLLMGEEVALLSQRERALRAAVVPQNPILPDAFSALEAVLMGRTPHLRLLQNEGPSDLEAARRAMLATDTWALADRPIGELSGGERQRVVLARALAQDTPLLLLDEPTAHLDIGHQASVLELMRKLCRSERKAVLAVVHDLTLSAQYCDRLIMLRAGAVVAEGDAWSVLRPELLEQVYGARADVLPHPRTGRPVVAPACDGA